MSLRPSGCFIPCALAVGFMLAPVAAQETKEKPEAEPQTTVKMKDGELTDPLEIVKRVDAAAKAVKAASYHSVRRGLGDAAAQIPTVEGTMIMTGWDGARPEKWVGDATVTMPNSTEKRHVTAGGDGDMFFVVDHAGKIAYEDMDPAVWGRTGQAPQGLIVGEFTHPTPFTDEINGRDRKLLGSKVVGGEDCYEVHVFYAQEGVEAIWCFSKKDFLPRSRRDKQRTRDGAEIWAERIITKLVIDPKITEETFKMKLPEGYTKTDDFAP